MRNEIEVSNARRQLVVTVVQNLSSDELLAMRSWAAQLLDIRESRGSKLQKARLALSATLASRVIWPAIKIAARKTKQIGWDNRGRTARLFVGASAIGVLVFGGQNAGIAALGTAVGIPLWIVLGAGASFANLLIEEISRRSSTASVDLRTTYTIIEADLREPRD
jgi:hypothetical protein